MLFWLILVIFVIGIILYNKSYEFNEVGILISVISGIIGIIMLFIIIINNAGAEACKVSNEELYKSLIYKSQTESIRDDFGIINKEYIDEIQEWNKDVVANKILQKDFWIGIFYPNIYDDFEIIDLNTIKMKEN